MSLTWCYPNSYHFCCQLGNNFFSLSVKYGISFDPRPNIQQRQISLASRRTRSSASSSTASPSSRRTSSGMLGSEEIVIVRGRHACQLSFRWYRNPAFKVDTYINLFLRYASKLGTRNSESVPSLKMTIFSDPSIPELVLLDAGEPVSFPTSLSLQRMV